MSYKVIQVGDFDCKLRKSGRYFSNSVFQTPRVLEKSLKKHHTLIALE